jgi:hypothetical protein
VTKACNCAFPLCADKQQMQRYDDDSDDGNLQPWDSVSNLSPAMPQRHCSGSSHYDDTSEANSDAVPNPVNNFHVQARTPLTLADFDRPGSMTPVDLAGCDLDCKGDRGIMENTGFPVDVWQYIGHKYLPMYPRCAPPCFPYIALCLT